MRDAIRPTTALAGPASLGKRQLALLFACWLLWYMAATLALETVARLAPAPLPRPVP